LATRFVVLANGGTVVNAYPGSPTTSGHYGVGEAAGLVDFIATGDRSEYVVSTLRDLEAFTRRERAALADGGGRTEKRLA
jgi:hypothetical protein